MAQYCRSCGSTLDDGVQFCHACGAAQAAASAPASGQAGYSNQQAPYTAPYPQAAPAPVYYGAPAVATPLSIGDYIVMMFVAGIPFVGFIMLLVWALGSHTNPNKKNWARAMLIWMLIGVVLAILLSATLAGLFGGLRDAAGFSY